MNRYIILIIIVTSIITSCSNSAKEETSEKYSVELKVSSPIILREDVLKVIEDYLDKYLQFDSFVLRYSPQLKITDGDSESNNYLFGPAYKQSIDKRSPKLYFDFKGKRIFIQCGLEELCNPSTLHDSIYHFQQIKNGRDSIVLGSNQVLKDIEIVYMHRSIYFSVTDSKISVNYRPDTVFLPKQLESTIFFDPNAKY